MIFDPRCESAGAPLVLNRKIVTEVPLLRLIMESRPIVVKVIC